MKSTNLLVQVLQNYNSGQGENGIITWTKSVSRECMLLDLGVLQGGLQVGESSWVEEQVSRWLQYKSLSCTRMEMRLIHSNFSTNITGFLHKVESYATTIIP